MTLEYQSANDIKQRLKDFSDLELDILNQIERLERIDAKMTSTSAKVMTGMPGGGSSSADKLTFMVAKKDDIEKKVKAMIAKRDAEKKVLDELINRLRKANERSVIQMRYYDNESWNEINYMVFGRNKDFEEREDTFLRRVHIIHGSALLNLSKLAQEDNNG